MKLKLIGLIIAAMTSCAEYPGKIIVDTPWGEASKDANVITVRPKLPLEEIKINVEK